MKDIKISKKNSNYICVEISGKGLELVVGEIDKLLYSKLGELMDEKDYSVSFPLFRAIQN